MIVIDSSVWIDQFRNADTKAVRKMKEIVETENILVGDANLLELLQGARNNREALIIESRLREFEIRSMLSEKIAIKAANNYRYLRQQGITIRKSIDMIIGTFCIEGDHFLLHDDRDFAPMVQHLGLMTY